MIHECGLYFRRVSGITVQRYLFFLLLSVFCPDVFAQPTPDDTTAVMLSPIVVEATRSSESESASARSIYIQSIDGLSTNAATSLQRALRGLPGVQINERGHFALGERLLIRGMGYRAAFGVRGAQVFLDGIPLTIADGQTMMDIVEPSIVGRTEVLRGPSSLYWGNSSGGVLFLFSDPDSSTLRLRGMAGGHGLQQLMVRSTTDFSAGTVEGFLSGIQRTGWREHSEGSFIRYGLRGRISLSPSSILGVTWAGAIQDVLAPGSLTQEQFDSNPSMADARYVSASAGKETAHNQVGITLNSETPFGTFSLSTYGIKRTLDNPLTFATIDLDRLAAGTYAQLHNQKERWRWSVGWDVRLQQDDRKNLRDDAIVLDQQERVRSASISGMGSFKLAPPLILSGGLRFDAIRFSMTDNHLSNGDQSGQRNMSALSPSIGLSYTAGPIVTYANLSTAFETPTTTELVNRPDTDGGFNTDLGSQRTLGLEAGFRGFLPAWNMRADVALYWMRIDDRLLPRQSEDGRTWYSNEGRNSHRGIDLALTWPTNHALSFHSALSMGRYVFLNEPGEGNHIPGVPATQGFFGISWSGRTFSAEVAANMATHSWADSNNTVRNDGHIAFDFYAGYEGLMIGTVSIQPFLSVTNLFDTLYATSLVVNAFGGRYFEPAPGRSLNAGLSISL